jgi:Protein of unknown function (DUF3667)
MANQILQEQEEEHRAEDEKGREVIPHTLTEANAPQIEDAPCADCGAKLSGVYCAACGQHRVEPPRKFWPLMREWVSAYFNLEGKLWTTLRVLITQPGELSLEYFRGRRTRYFPPLKLYLTMSVIFFSLATLRMYAVPTSGSSKEKTRTVDEDEAAAAAAMTDEVRDEIEKEMDDPSAIAKFMRPIERVSTKIAKGKRRAQEENRQLTVEEKQGFESQLDGARLEMSNKIDELPTIARGAAKRGSNAVLDSMQRSLTDDSKVVVNTKPETAEERRERIESLVESVGRSSPRALFFFLPLFAAVYAYCFRKQSVYAENFVFTLHLHSFFLTLAIIDLIIPSTAATAIMLLGMAVYSSLAMRRVYRISRLRVFSATAFASTCYLILFSLIGSLSEKVSVLGCILAGRCG